MAIDATFWVAVSFAIFFGALIYFKIPQKVTEMLERVEVNHERPEDVYAERAAELRRMDWKTWLRQVRLILKDVPMGDNLDSGEAYEVMKKIKTIITELGNAEENQNA